MALGIFARLGGQRAPGEERRGRTLWERVTVPLELRRLDALSRRQNLEAWEAIANKGCATKSFEVGAHAVGLLASHGKWELVRAVCSHGSPHVAKHALREAFEKRELGVLEHAAGNAPKAAADFARDEFKRVGAADVKRASAEKRWDVLGAIVRMGEPGPAKLARAEIEKAGDADVAESKKVFDWRAIREIGLYGNEKASANAVRVSVHDWIGCYGWDVVRQVAAHGSGKAAKLAQDELRKYYEGKAQHSWAKQASRIRHESAEFQEDLIGFTPS